MDFTIHSKLRSLPEFLAEFAERRRLGHKLVFINGCFDIVHAGHVQVLCHARQLGDFLLVALNSDESVRRLKGPGRPLHCVNDRVAVLDAIEYVDAIVIFETDTPLELLEIVKPDVLVKGAEYRLEDVVGRDFVEANGGRIVLVPLLEGLSSSRLRAH